MVQTLHLVSAATMSSLAHDAITIVLREHAGRLKSFKADERKILNRTHEILQECETKAEESMNVGRWEDVGRVREQTLKRLQKFAPTEETYIATWFKTVRNYKKRLSDDRRNEKRRQRTILNQTHEILRECERKAEEFTNAGRLEAVGRIREQTLKRLQKFAPTEETYIDTWFKTVDNYKQQLADDKRKERHVKRRTTQTAD